MRGKQCIFHLSSVSSEPAVFSFGKGGVKARVGPRCEASVEGAVQVHASIAPVQCLLLCKEAAPSGPSPALRLVA